MAASSEIWDSWKNFCLNRKMFMVVLAQSLKAGSLTTSVVLGFFGVLLETLRQVFCKETDENVRDKERKV